MRKVDFLIGTAWTAPFAMASDTLGYRDSIRLAHRNGTKIPLVPVLGDTAP
ncbi:MAG: hypothetical protein QOF90_2618 [Acetobacteraceae bacterium]|jgi:hypothetical protein|nr:hypothetical protein [Acetobacteraceae bacterium]